MRKTFAWLPTTTLATLALTVASAATMAQAPPGPDYDGRDKKYELSAGSTLRAGPGLTDRLLYTVWQRTTVLGSGRCTEGACPLTFDGQQVFARRSRLTLLDATAGAGQPPAAGQAQSSGGRYPDGWSRLQRGDKGDNVRRLQELLIRDGAKLTADGNFGRGTEAAVRDLQRRKGLKADGVAGFETLRALGV